MPISDPLLRTPRALLIAALLIASPAFGQGAPAAAQQNHSFHLDTAGVVSRSTILLERPNLLPSEAMPLGNGQLGVAVWSADGMTVQLNRNDTMPARLSLGQLTIPGLAPLTAAADYTGRLDLYNGEFRERGGGLSATVYVQPNSDLLIIDVTGADPHRQQTATLSLWPPRAPHAFVHGHLGILAESWADDQQPGASNRRFGTLAALTADAIHVSATVQDSRSVRLTFLPHPDGSFRLLVPAPHWVGETSAPAATAQPLSSPAPAAHRLWWHRFWAHTGLIRIDSADAVGAYMENLRNLYLFYAASERGRAYPGSQAGIADMLSSVRDTHHWDPAAFWHWNLRMQVAANLSAGHPELNLPYFSLYRNDLANIEQWTRQHMRGRPGICIPETMRFNGPGIEYELWSPTSPVIGLNCDAASPPYYNARTLSTGAEVAYWVWQQYLFTGDKAFLAQNYPLLREASRFLIAYEQPGSDGLRHTSPSNAHEIQWDTVDPTTDLLARRTLFQETLDVATLLREDPTLVARLRTELTQIPPLPRTQFLAKTLLPPASDKEGNDVIAESTLPIAKQHNFENIGLEPVWPYSLIGDDSPLTPLARRTFLHRPFPTNQDWSFDPIQAARLGLGSDVASTLTYLTRRYQTYPNGMANWGGNSGEFYIEQSGVAAAALDESLVQDFDGLIRIAPAIPPGWDFTGVVYVRGRTRVDVQTRAGGVRFAAIEAGSSGTLRVRNPWRDTAVRLIDEAPTAATRATPIAAAAGAVLTFHALQGHTYRLLPSSLSGLQAGPQPSFTPVTGAPPTAPRRLGNRGLGLSAPAPAAPS